MRKYISVVSTRSLTAVFPLILHAGYAHCGTVAQRFSPRSIFSVGFKQQLEHIVTQNTPLFGRCVWVGGAFLCVVAQPVGAVADAQLAHHFALDLADALAGQAEFAADLVEGARHTVVKPVAQADDILLALL